MGYRCTGSETHTCVLVKHVQLLQLNKAWFPVLTRRCWDGQKGGHLRDWTDLHNLMLLIGMQTLIFSQNHLVVHIHIVLMVLKDWMMLQTEHFVVIVPDLWLELMQGVQVAVVECVELG